MLFVVAAVVAVVVGVDNKEKRSQVPTIQSGSTRILFSHDYHVILAALKRVQLFCTSTLRRNRLLSCS